MVYRGNPKGVQSVADLGRADIVVSQPDPEHEHIAAHVIAMYEQAGGPSLAARILEEKRAGGTTRMTTVHHRETPQRLIQGDADAGPVWHTEIIEAQGRGLPLEGVEVGADLDQRDAVEYWIAPLKGGQNRENAMKFLEFIASPPARRIFTAHGFAPP
jgi:ABC-type molybdate transport system substrate-binding protein